MSATPWRSEPVRGARRARWVRLARYVTGMDRDRVGRDKAPVGKRLLDGALERDRTCADGVRGRHARHTKPAPPVRRSCSLARVQRAVLSDRTSLNGVRRELLPSPLGDAVDGWGEKEPGMALKQGRTKTVGHLPHDAVVRVDKRVKEILARREAALQHARRAAERLKRR